MHFPLSALALLASGFARLASGQGDICTVDAFLGFSGISCTGESLGSITLGSNGTIQTSPCLTVINAQCALVTDADPANAACQALLYTSDDCTGTGDVIDCAEGTATTQIADFSSMEMFCF